MKTNFRIMYTFDNGIGEYLNATSVISAKYSEYEYININEEIGLLGTLYLFPVLICICVKLTHVIVDKKPI